MALQTHGAPLAPLSLDSDVRTFPSRFLTYSPNYLSEALIFIEECGSAWRPGRPGQRVFGLPHTRRSFEMLTESLNRASRAFHQRTANKLSRPQSVGDERVSAAVPIIHSLHLSKHCGS